MHFLQISLACVTENKNLSVFRSLRTLRALRPLRAISRLEGMKVIWVIIPLIVKKKK